MDLVPCSCFPVNMKNQWEWTITGRRSKHTGLETLIPSGTRAVELEHSGQDWQKEYCPTSHCPCKPTPAKKKKNLNGGSSFYSDWNNLLEIKRDIPCFTPMCLGYSSGVDDLLTCFAVLWWLFVCLFFKIQNTCLKNLFST